MDYHEELLFTDLTLFNRKLADWLVVSDAERPHHSFGQQSPLSFLLQHQPECQRYWTHPAYWSIERWRLRSRKAEMMGAALAAIRRGEDFGKTDDLLFAHEQAESCLLALDAALLTICADNGIDPADVRRVAGAEPFKPMREGVAPDGEMQAAMQSAFAQLLAV